MKFTGQVLVSALFFSTSAFGAAVWNVKNLDKRITVVARDTEVSPPKRMRNGIEDAARC